MCVAGVTRPSRRHPPRHAVTSDTQLWSVLGPRRMGPGPGPRLGRARVSKHKHGPRQQAPAAAVSL